MRVTKFLTIPPDLEAARAAGDLVVFAGAGTSMGEPANLPGFEALARQIAEPVIPWDEGYKTRLDTYLGAAERAEVLVQSRARGILSTKGGRHTPLHRHLLALFGHEDKVRLISTNFDPFFGTASAEEFGEHQIPDYVGPALPPGRAFRGIVSLHGSLTHPQNRLVLTDGDFADAYIAEAWAARFLAGVFNQRSVLFIGYSLTDPVMTYLMRALSPSGGWFALCQSGDAAHWSDYEIEPVVFGDPTAADPFEDLRAGMARWSWYARASPTDHDEEVRRIVSVSPSSLPLDSDYLRARLDTEHGKLAFWTTAKDVGWLDWTTTEGLLGPLLDPRSSDPDAGRWSRWVLENYTEGETPPLLAMLRRGLPGLNFSFVEELARYLWQIDVNLPEPVLRQLIAVITSQPWPAGRRSDSFVWLMEKLIGAGRFHETLCVLAWMTQVRLKERDRLLSRFFEAEGDDEGLRPLAMHIDMPGGDDTVRFLRNHGAALAAEVPTQLLELGLQRLRDAYRLMRLSGAVTEVFDWVSYSRTAIAASNQDQFEEAEDILVIMVRTALEYWAQSHPARLERFAAEYSGAEETLLRRLALFSWGLCPAGQPSSILEQAAAEGWAQDIWIRPELYRLLDRHYEAATEDERGVFLAAAKAGYESGNEHDAHARFSLSQKLERISPDSTVTRDFAKAERVAHPEWREADTDGLLTRVEVGWGSGETSPVSTDSLFEWSAAELLETISAKREEWSTAEIREVVGLVRIAAVERPAWGIDIVQELAVSDAEAGAVLDAALWGLRDADCTGEQRLTVLSGLGGGDWPEGATQAIGMVLDEWSKNLGKDSAPEYLDQLDAVADALYERGGGVPLQEGLSWVHGAYNHPGGHAALTWWRVADARDWVDGKYEISLDEAELDRWTRVVRDQDPSAAAARPILGMALGRLHVGNAQWAREVITPAFAWPESTAAQLWAGRLSNNRWAWTAIHSLLEHLKGLFRHLGALDEGTQAAAGHFVAFATVNTAESQFTAVHLTDFFGKASEKARVAFAESLAKKMVETPVTDQRVLWDSVVCPLLRDRQTNVPSAATATELAAMLGWVTELPELADEVIAELERFPRVEMAHAESVLWAWKRDDEWVRRHPTAATRVVRFLLDRRSLPGWVSGEAVDVLETSLDCGADSILVRDVAEALVAQFADQRAISLVGRIKHATDEPEDPNTGSTDGPPNTDDE